MPNSISFFYFVLLIIVSFPILWVDTFLLVTLNRKIGFFRFLLLVGVWLCFLGLTLQLIAIGYTIIFLALHILSTLFGVYVLRKEFIDSIKDEWQVAKNIIDFVRK
jgi:hypothetical protein